MITSSPSYLLEMADSDVELLQREQMRQASSAALDSYNTKYHHPNTKNTLPCHTMMTSSPSNLPEMADNGEEQQREHMRPTALNSYNIKYHHPTNTKNTLPCHTLMTSSPSHLQELPDDDDGGDDDEALLLRNEHTRPASPAMTPVLVRLAMRASRSRWFTFLRRVFQYQNGTGPNLGSNPFNSKKWMVLELISLCVQIGVSLITLKASMDEKPTWPMRIWVVGYDFGCVISLFILLWRYKHNNLSQGGGDNNGNNIVDLEQQMRIEDSRILQVVNKCKSSLDLFYAMWFVMGNIWIFDSRFGSINGAPKLQILCISILVWNALTYSFPFLLFLLLCIFVPLVSSFIGYNMSLGACEKGACDDQIDKLVSWRYKDLGDCHGKGSSSPSLENHECCICLAKYKEREEIRQLPCHHIFHKKCVDQWLRIISCCPLCKQGLDI